MDEEHKGKRIVDLLYIKCKRGTMRVRAMNKIRNWDIRKRIDYRRSLLEGLHKGILKWFLELRDCVYKGSQEPARQFGSQNK